MAEIIVNVMIADGSGGAPFAGALRFGGGRILAVGPEVAAEPGDRVLDGGGKLLTPGLIDTHGHSDISAIAAPAATGKIAQGVATEVAGNCGLSPFPVTALNREHLTELYANYGVKLDWDDYAGYRRALAKSGTPLKIVSLCGHNTLRAAVAGYETRELAAAQLDAMCELLARELAAGAAGLSLGLIYTPGCFASPAEVERLLRVVAAADKIFSIHLRSEGNELLPALKETIGAAEAAGQRRIMISHFKTAGKPNWHKLDAALALIEAGRARGLEIFFDRYPYIESMTQLSVVAPREYAEMIDSALKTRLQDPAEFRKLVVALEQGGRDWTTVRLASSSDPLFSRYAGRIVTEIAAELGRTPPELVAEVLRADAPGANGAFRGMSEANMIRILGSELCCCGTDESARPTSLELGRSHPRGFGAFPEFFRHLRAAGLPVGEIVRKCTALPAEIFRLADRGRLRPGLAADLALIDLEKFRSDASFEHPHRPAAGVELWIDGVPVAR